MKELRHSKKREAILKIFENGDLLEASEVYEKFHWIDRATVYRNLTLFVEQGLLREVHIKKGVASYEFNTKGDNHQHFLCGKCEKVIPIDINYDEMKKIIPVEVQFEEFELNLKGTCKDCKKLF